MPLGLLNCPVQLLSSIQLYILLTVKSALARFFMHTPRALLQCMSLLVLVKSSFMVSSTEWVVIVRATNLVQISADN